MAGFLNEKSIFIEQQRVVSINPIVHILIVLAGSEISSAFLTTAATSGILLASLARSSLSSLSEYNQARNWPFRWRILGALIFRGRRLPNSGLLKIGSMDLALELAYG
jgi:hypothetical protein